MPHEKTDNVLYTKAHETAADSCGSGLFPLYDIPPVLAVLQFTENRSICVCQAAGDISHASHTGRLYNQLNQVTFDILGSFKNSLLISFCTMIISVTLAIPAAYGLARFRIKGKNLIVFLFLVSQMLPQIFTLIPNFIIFKKIGIYNTYWRPFCQTAP